MQFASQCHQAREMCVLPELPVVEPDYNVTVVCADNVSHVFESVLYYEQALLDTNSQKYQLLLSQTQPPS